MRANYKTRIYTKRISSISNAGIEKLRQTQLKNQNISTERKRFIKSYEFDKTIRRNIKENRAFQNRQAIGKIQKLATTPQQEKVLIQIFGEKTQRNGSKIVRTNGFTTLKQTNRLKKIVSKIENGTFNPMKHIKSTTSYREKKRYLPSSAGLGDILNVINSTQFYLENKDLVRQYNNLVNSKGRLYAESSKIGNQLRNTYIESTEPDDIFLNLISKKV